MLKLELEKRKLDYFGIVQKNELVELLLKYQYNALSLDKKVLYNPESCKDITRPKKVSDDLGPTMTGPKNPPAIADGCSNTSCNQGMRKKENLWGCPCNTVWYCDSTCHIGNFIKKIACLHEAFL